MTILRGHFTMMLVVSTPDGADEDALRRDLEGAADSLGLEAISLSEIAEVDPESEPLASHIVTVYGVDHPGIVHAVATAMSEREVDIIDLNTRLVGEGEGEPLYALMMEVALPASVSAGDLEDSLAAVGEAQGVEVTLRELEQDAL